MINSKFYIALGAVYTGKKTLRDRTDDPSPEQAYEMLMAMGAAFREAAASLEEAQQMRDAAIIVSSERGLSRRKVAAAAGVTVGRVQQVLSGTDSRTRKNLAERILEIAANRLPVPERERYAEEWRAELAASGMRPRARLAFALSLLWNSSSLLQALSPGAVSEDTRE